MQRLHREVKALIRASTMPMPRRKADALERDIEKAIARLAVAPAATANDLDAKFVCLIWQLRRRGKADPELLVRRPEFALKTRLSADSLGHRGLAGGANDPEIQHSLDGNAFCCALLRWFDRLSNYSCFWTVASAGSTQRRPSRVAAKRGAARCSSQERSH